MLHLVGRLAFNKCIQTKVKSVLVLVYVTSGCVLVLLHFIVFTPMERIQRTGIQCMVSIVRTRAMSVLHRLGGCEAAKVHPLFDLLYLGVI